jgi:hypothetical protein
MLKKLKRKKSEMEIFNLISFLFSLSHNNKYIKTIIENFLFTPLIEIHNPTWKFATVAFKIDHLGDALLISKTLSGICVFG